MSGIIFINYRRRDDPGNTGRLFERLVAEGFKPEQLFMDVDSIKPGVDFLRDLHEQVERCDVLLAVIGKGWIEARDERGGRCIDNPEDYVRIEIEAALKQDKRVVPVLMLDARMPRGDELPDALKPLATRNAVRLSHERFRIDAQSLAAALRDALEDVSVARRIQAETTRQVLAEKEQRRELEAVRQRELAQREADEQARSEKEQARRDAIVGLSAEQIAKAEELANWDFIKASSHAEDFRDHLARFPNGVCERMARHRLSTLAWAALGDAPTREALQAYGREFPDGPHAEDARRRLALLEREDEQRADDRPPPRMFVDTNPAGGHAGSGSPDSKQRGPSPMLSAKKNPMLLAKKKMALAALAIVFAGAGTWVISSPRRVTVESLTLPKSKELPKSTEVPKSTASSQCPSVTEGAYADLTLKAGFSPNRRAVSPGGAASVPGCRPEWKTREWRGWVSPKADLAFRFETPGNVPLTIEVSSMTDTILLINDPSGTWHFDDDSAGSPNPRIRFPMALQGRYDIWVGTYSETKSGVAGELIIAQR